MKKQNINFLVELFNLMAFCKFVFPFATSSEASTACRQDAALTTSRQSSMAEIFLQTSTEGF